MAPSVVIASHNEHKIEEFRRILTAIIPRLAATGYDGPEPRETGTSFRTNALLKARAAAAHTGRMALADDSGICVDVLGGAPGIFSARWAGRRASAEANRQLLLEQLADISEEHRFGYFQCSLALVVPSETGFTDVFATGRWPGRIAGVVSGAGGFGYDPIFIPEGYQQTVAELPAAVKDAESHRSRAFQALLPQLQQFPGMLP